MSKRPKSTCMLASGGGSRGGVSGVTTPPPKWSELQYECSTIDVHSHGDALAYIAKRLVVV